MKRAHKFTTKMIIGTRAYPRDNSYSFPVNKQQKMVVLGGTFNTEAKKVTIVSEPYLLRFVSCGRERVEEFVTVKYRGRLFVVLNSFKDSA